MSDHRGRDRGGGGHRLQPLQGLAQETRASGTSKKEHQLRGKLDEIEMMRKALVAKKEALHDESYPAGRVRYSISHESSKDYEYFKT